MMSTSTAQDDLEAMERAAHPAPMPTGKGGPRRGSSMFSGPEAMPIHSSTSVDADGFPILMMEPAPHFTSPSSSPASDNNNNNAPKRSSVVLQPMAGIGGLVDFDSDFEDSDEEEPPRPPAAGLPGYPVPPGYPGSGGAPPRTAGPPPPGPTTGGPNYRPMVGGFAAAAYEAARAYHYQHQIKRPTAPTRTGPPPSI